MKTSKSRGSCRSFDDVTISTDLVCEWIWFKGWGAITKEVVCIIYEKETVEGEGVLYNRIPTLLVNNSTSQVPFQMLCENIVENVE